MRLHVSRLVVGAAMVLTGVAPFLYLKLLPVTGPGSLLVAAFLIRRFAIDRIAPIRVPAPRRLLLCIGGGSMLVGLAVIVSFGVTHPLWPNSVNVNDRRVSFTLRNAGFAKITILGVSTDAYAGFTPWTRHRVNGLVVPARGSRWVTLQQRGCPPRDLTVRYRVFGRVMTAPLRPSPPPLELRC